MFKKMIFSVLALALIATAAQAGDWTIDKSHSSVNFEVRHLVVSKTRGSFGDFEGTAKFEEGKLADGSATVTVQMASVDTDSEDRDNHLRNADFFDVEKHPTMSFTSTKVIPGDGDKFKLVGNLTIKDVTKEVTFDCEYYGTVNDPWGNTRAGFSAETTIDRQDFNVEYNSVLDTGGLAVGNDVKITLELELVKAKA